MAQSSLDAAGCVVSAIKAALEQKVPVDDDMLALILARMQGVYCEVCAVFALDTVTMKQWTSMVLQCLATLLGFLGCQSTSCSKQSSKDCLAGANWQNLSRGKCSEF
jgi:hypothetical protein